MKHPRPPKDAAPRQSGRPSAPAPQGINRESEMESDLRIGPTSTGMVRLYITAPGVDLPMDFDPDDAEAIAEELMAAAQAVRG